MRGLVSYAAVAVLLGCSASAETPAPAHGGSITGLVATTSDEDAAGTDDDGDPTRAEGALATPREREAQRVAISNGEATADSEPSRDDAEATTPIRRAADEPCDPRPDAPPIARCEAPLVCCTRADAGDEPDSQCSRAEQCGSVAAEGDAR